MKNEDFLRDIKAVGFDFDDTLVGEKYSINKRWEKVLESYSYLSPDLKETFFRIYESKGPSYKFHVNDALKELKIDESASREIVSKFLTAEGDEMLLDNALDILKLLEKNKIIKGIITDGKKSFQEGRLKQSGIYGFFDFALYGNGKKERKPNKETLDKIYKLFKKFSVQNLSQFLFVGNDYKSDISGFLSLGAKVCWITDQKSTPLNNKMIIVKNLRELINLWEKEF